MWLPGLDGDPAVGAYLIVLTIFLIDEPVWRSSQRLTRKPGHQDGQMRLDRAALVLVDRPGAQVGQALLACYTWLLRPRHSLGLEAKLDGLPTPVT